MKYFLQSSLFEAIILKNIRDFKILLRITHFLLNRLRDIISFKIREVNKKERIKIRQQLKFL